MEETGLPASVSGRQHAVIKDVTDTVIEAVASKGAMGLPQAFAAFGNASAMVIIAILLFASQWYVTAMHTQSMASQTALHQEQSATMKAIIERQDRQAEVNEQRHADERKAMQSVVERNSGAIDRLAEEVKLSRIARTKDGP